jgi:membrane protease YdiL (CAAX protease family)
MARVSFVGVKRLAVALAWLVAFAVVGVVASVVLAALLAPLGGIWWLARNGLSEMGGFAIATLVVGRLLDRHEWSSLGWRTPRRIPVWFGTGLLAGGAMAAAAIALSLADGAAVVRTPGWRAFPAVAGPLALGLCAAALAEELMFRGYPLRRLSEAVGANVATGLFALVFAAAHLANPNAGAFGTANIVLAALWLSAAFFSGAGMALAWGLHAGWNITIAVLFDAPVSGLHFDVPGVDYVLGRHAWVGGGAFGPEGGVVATLALLAGTAVLLGRRLPHPARWFTSPPAGPLEAA